MRVETIIVVLALCLAGAPAWGQASTEPADDGRCLDAKGHDRCAESIAKLFAEDYGLPQAETVSRNADLTLRISEYAFNTREPALVFTVHRGQSAHVAVYPPRNRARSDAPAFELDLLPAEIRKVERLAALIATIPIEVPTPPPPADASEWEICVSEGYDAFEVARRGSVVRRSSAPCSKDSAFDDAQVLARSIAAGLSPCRRFLDRRGGRPFSTLRICSSLSGNLGAAADALERAIEFRGIAHLAEPAGQDGYLERDVQLLTADAEQNGAAALLSAWRNLDPKFEIIRVTGESGRQATIEGHIVTETYEKRSDGHSHFVESRRAPFTQVWRKVSGSWRLARMCTGSWALDAHREDPPGVDRAEDAWRASGAPFAPRGPAC